VACQRLEQTMSSNAHATIDIDNDLAIAWMDQLMTSPACNQRSFDSLYLAHCRMGLQQSCGRTLTPLPSVCVQSLAQINQCSARGGMMAPGLFNAPLSSRGPTAPPADGWSRLPASLQDALMSPTNAGGNIAGALLGLDAMYLSLPPDWHVRLNGGSWQLVDANKSARNHAFAKAGKAKYPPRMQLRIPRDKLRMVPPGATVRNGLVRVPVPGAGKGVPLSEALQLSGMNKVKPISEKAYRALAGRRLLASAFSWHRRRASPAIWPGLRVGLWQAQRWPLSASPLLRS
jgi:hypothetical protein